MRKSLNLTALSALLSLTRPRFGDDDNRAQWERDRAAELEGREKAALAVKVARLESDLKTKTDRLTELTAKLPPEGGVILSKADAERWAAYQTFGKPEELKTRLAERDTFEQESAGLKAEKHMGEVGRVSGVKTAALARLAPEGTVYEVTKGKDAEGKDIDLVRVKDKDGKDLGELTDWIGKSPELADFKAALLPGEVTPLPTTTTPTLTPPLGGAGGTTTSRTPEQVKADKLGSGEYSI
jgi:hypothetical protein